MHYKTFKVIDTDPQVFLDKANEKGFDVTILDVGKSLEY
jgi:L-ascorbate metabolism protein UlaG (beta-lactamase superfamily)